MDAAVSATSADAVAKAAATALSGPLLRRRGVLRPLAAALAQWHLLSGTGLPAATTAAAVVATPGRAAGEQGWATVPVILLQALKTAISSCSTLRLALEEAATREAAVSARRNVHESSGDGGGGHGGAGAGDGGGDGGSGGDGSGGGSAGHKEATVEETTAELNRVMTLLCFLAGKAAGVLVSGGVGRCDGGEVPNDIAAAQHAEARSLPLPSAGNGEATIGNGGGSGDARPPSVGPGPRAAEFEWLRSPLLANGLLPLPPSPPTAPESTPVAAAVAVPAEGKAERQQQRKVPALLSSAGTVATAAAPKGQQMLDFLRDLVENREGTPAATLAAWAKRYSGENPVLARLGGPLIDRSVR
ncbi:unnamed protein product, partial [Phaeothamnion confervicola]